MRTSHIVDHGALGFRCTGCGGVFEAPRDGDAGKLRTAAHAWAELHEDCRRPGPLEAEKVGHTWGPGVAQARAR
jgi:rubredoxin